MSNVLNRRMFNQGGSPQYPDPLNRGQGPHYPTLEGSRQVSNQVGGNFVGGITDSLGELWYESQYVMPEYRKRAEFVLRSDHKIANPTAQEIEKLAKSLRQKDQAAGHNDIQINTGARGRPGFPESSPSQLSARDRAELSDQGFEQAELPPGGIASIQKKTSLDMPSYKPVDFEKEMGDMDREYSNWDYIRDLSAQLLASDSPRFLQALGQGQQVTAAKRDKIEGANHDLKAKIKMKTLEARELANRERYKQEAKAKIEKYKNMYGDLKLGQKPIYSSVYNKDNQEVSVKLWPVDKGDPRISRDPDSIVVKDGKYFVIERATDNVKFENKVYTHLKDYKSDLMAKVDKPELIQSVVNDILMDEEKDGEFLLSLQQMPGWDKLRGKFIEANEEAAVKMVNAIESGNAEEAAKWLETLQGMPQLMKAMKEFTYAGLASDMSDPDYKRIADLAGERAIKAAGIQFRDALNKNTTWNSNANMDFKNAVRSVIRGIEWDAKNSSLKYDLDNTKGERNKAASEIDTIAGTDTADDLFVVELFNQKEYPKSHTLGKAGLKPKFNYDELSQNEQGEMQKDFLKIQKNMVKRGIPAKQASNSIMSSFIESNVIQGDAPFWSWWGSDSDNVKYTAPDTWHIEPGSPEKRDEARANGWDWDGFQGHWFYYATDAEGNLRKDAEGRPVKRIVEPKGEFKPKTLSLR